MTDSHMKQLIGKSCRLSIRQPVTGKILFYTVKKVLNVTDTHILFIDKYDSEYSYRLQDLLQVQDISDTFRGGDNGKRRQ